MATPHNNLPKDSFPNRLRRGIGYLTAGGLGVLAVVATSGGSKAKKYDAETEAALQHAMRPAMVNIARKVVNSGFELNSSMTSYGSDSRIYPGNESQNTDSIIIGTIKNGVRRRIKVVMGEDPKTGQPDPDQVELVKINVNTMHGGASSNSTIALVAPHAEVSLPVAIRTEDWSAAEMKSGMAGDMIVNSSDSDQPIATAERVVSAVTRNFQAMEIPG